MIELADIAVCADLRFILEYEMAHGNAVAGISAPAGTTCQYAVSFAERLKIIGTPAVTRLPPHVKAWECRDAHYALEAGYYCAAHEHSVAGPLVD